MFIKSPNAYPVCIDGFIEKNGVLKIRMRHQSALVDGLLHSSYICPFLLGMDTQAYCEFFLQKFGKEEGMRLYMSELQKFNEGYDDFSKCNILLANKQTVTITLCAMTGSFEVTKRKNVSYNNTLGVDLSSYKDEMLQLIYPIHIYSCQPVSYKLIETKKGKEKKLIVTSFPFSDT